MKYTIHGTFNDYVGDIAYKSGAIPYIDSEGNIFPSATACAKYHGVSSSTVQRGISPFTSKTLDKKVCASYISTDVLSDFLYLDGQHNEELESCLSIYDELFNDYIFKGIPASICRNGWAGPNKISRMLKTRFGWWTPAYEKPEDEPFLFN